MPGLSLLSPAFQRSRVSARVLLAPASLAVAGPAAAEEYRPDEFLKLDLSKALLSPKRLGPETQFAPVDIEAKTDGAQADADASVWPKPPERKLHVARTHVVKPHVEKT